MYHIVAAKRQRQYGPALWKNQPPDLFAVSSDTPGLIKLAAAILAGIGGMDEQKDVSTARRNLDPIAAGEKEARAGFKTQPVQRVLPKRLLDPFTEIVRSVHFAGLESACQSAAQLALGLGGLESRPIDPDPGAPSRRASANVGRDLIVWPKSEANEIVPGGMSAAQDAFTLRRMRFAP